MKKRIGVWLSLMVLLAGIVPAAMAAPAKQAQREFVVVYADGVSVKAARAAISAAGGTLVRENAAVGVATVRSSNPNFIAAVAKQPALRGAAANAAIGHSPRLIRPVRDDVERLTKERAAAAGQAQQSGSAAVRQAALDEEPLAPLQWDMEMINATVDGSYAVQPGDEGVLVGIIDSGIDGSHPDIAPNFNLALSRNFATDMPDIDGPCEVPSCVDPPDADDNGHGTHVAGTVGAALNGLGLAGVAPNITLVNIRGGQDSGYVFLQPVVDALVYAGDIGIDVVNMSFYIDPWLFNCTNNPADLPEDQLEQTLTRIAVQRAVNYARRHGVTPVGSLGNAHTDLSYPTFDGSSPDYPPGSEYDRDIDNSCLVMPTEAEGVLSVSALGPSFRKAYYSNYGVEQTTVSAPGGDFYDTAQPQPANLILSTYPQALAELNGELNPDGSPNTPFVVRDCQDDVCAYYQYLQGTSMASPHATGVAALIVSEYGRPDPFNAGLRLSPVAVEDILTDTAAERPCPDPPLYDYPPPIPASYNALCEGDEDFNGFYGHGVVDALAAVSPR